VLSFSSRGQRSV